MLYRSPASPGLNDAIHRKLARFSGIAKAPIFGFIIAIIGCYRGFQVTGSTDSIGKFTTISVVNAIFWVIALNAVFSVLFTQLGI